MAGAENATADLASIIAGLEEAVVAVDGAGKVTLANPAAAMLFGADPKREEVWAGILQRNHWLAAGLQTALQEGRSHVLHQVRCVLLNNERTVGLRISPHFNELGALRGAICLLFDQSSLEALSENVRQLDKLQEFGVLAAGLAHEVKNPLGGILGAAQLLRSENLTQDARECIDLIERDVRRINRLIEELLNFGNDNPLVRETINLHELIDRVLQGLRLDPVAAGHPVIRDFDPSLPPIPMHGDGIHQVLLNLFKNALEASHPGAPMVVRTRVDLAARRVTGRAVLIEVQNEGPGMAEDVKAQLFTPFFTTKPVGVGLGLPVSLRIVRAHGGALDVTSEDGKTCFCLALPMELPAERPRKEVE